MTKLVAVTVLAVTLGVPLAGQTLSEQLEKAIFAEEVLKDRDQAERIYRQIVASTAVPRLIGQEAERRLARLTAPQPHSGVATFTPPPVVFGTAMVPPGAFTGEMTFTPALHSGRGLGVVEAGRYRNFASGVSFLVPSGFSVAPTTPSSDDGENVVVIDRSSGVEVNVWMIREETPRAALAARIAGAPEAKLRQRHSGYNIPGMGDPNSYQIPRETVRELEINGRQAISALGNYNGVEFSRFPSRQFAQPMHEYMIWIVTEHARAFFYARAPVAELPALHRAVEQVANGATIP